MCAALGPLARRRVLERYSLEKNIDALVALYNELRERVPASR